MGAGMAVASLEVDLLLLVLVVVKEGEASIKD